MDTRKPKGKNGFALRKLRIMKDVRSQCSLPDTEDRGYKDEEYNPVEFFFLSFLRADKIKGRWRRGGRNLEGRYKKK